MAYDLNEAQEQREFGALIPDGTFVKLKGFIRPGNASLPAGDAADAGLFKAANAPSDAIMLDWEFTVMHGTFARQKLWQMMVVAGGSVDDKGQSKAGNITKSTLRAMLESALGIDPKDESAQAKQQRVLASFAHLDGIEFAARVGIEKGQDDGRGGNYRDKNRIAFVVTPDQPEWKVIMDGGEAPPKPTGTVIPPRSNGGGTASAPAWQRNAAPVPGARPVWGGNGAAGDPAAIARPAAPAALTPAPSGPAWLRK